VDFTPILRAIQATNPDVVFVGSYPPDSAGMVRAANELDLQTKLFGGGMVGLQYASLLTSLGPMLNGIVNYDFWVPEPTLDFPGIQEFLAKYQERAKGQGVDPLGHAEPVSAGDKRIVAVRTGRVQQIGAAVALADLQDVGEPRRRDDRRPRPGSLDQGVDGDRAPVAERVHVARVDPGALADGVETAGQAGEEVVGAQRLDRVDVVVTDEDGVRERAPDVDSDRTHGRGKRPRQKTPLVGWIQPSIVGVAGRHRRSLVSQA
jgi:hypothetical protein